MHPSITPSQDSTVHTIRVAPSGVTRKVPIIRQPPPSPEERTTSFRVCPKCGGPQEAYRGAVYLECGCNLGYRITRAEALRPTAFVGGTPEKSALLNARYEHGIYLFNSGDATERNIDGRYVVLPDPEDDDGDLNDGDIE